MARPEAHAAAGNYADPRASRSAAEALKPGDSFFAECSNTVEVGWSSILFTVAAGRDQAQDFGGDPRPSRCHLENCKVAGATWTETNGREQKHYDLTSSFVWYLIKCAILKGELLLIRRAMRWQRRKDTDRPGLDEMKQAQRGKFDVVMAWAIDPWAASFTPCGVDLYLDGR